jgi:biotin carboxyl carrier protein
MKYITTVDGKEFTLEIKDEKHILVNDKVLEIDFESVDGQPVYSLLIDGKSHEGYVYADETNWQVLLRGRLYQATVEDEREKRLRATTSGISEDGEFHLKAPMPGLIIAIPVSEGEMVQKGQVLIILESMKMQNELKSPREGKIHRIRVKPGDTVEQKQPILSVV